VKHKHPQCEMIGINYGGQFPFDKILPGEVVCMVDFCLQPFSDMLRLNTLADLRWIDHHKSAIEEAGKHAVEVRGLRQDGIGACALTWKYFHSTKVPHAVQLLAEYDVWDHHNPATLPFQYGMRFEENTKPDNQELWQPLFKDACIVADIVETGKTILEYEKRQNAKLCSYATFETEINGLKAIALNRGFTNSKIFDSVWDNEKYDVMLTFSRLALPAKKWTVSLYTDKPGIDCSVIAKSFGGGGHIGASGFQCDDLPFEY